MISVRDCNLQLVGKKRVEFGERNTIPVCVCVDSWWWKFADLSLGISAEPVSRVLMHPFTGKFSLVRDDHFGDVLKELGNAIPSKNFDCN